MSDSLWLWLFVARPPCPLLSPGVCPSSSPLHRWYHLAFSSSVTLFSCRQSFPASRSFPVSQLFTSGGKNIGVSVLTSVLPKNTQDWSLYNGLVGSLCCPRDSQESSPTPQFKASILWHSAFFIGQLSHLYMTTGKTIALTRQAFVDKVMSVLFNML